MLTQLKKTVRLKFLAATLLAGITLSGATIFSSLVLADQFDDQIRELQQQNSAHQQVSNQLAAEASSYQDAISKLQAQINGLHQVIIASQQKSDALQKEIEAAQAELDRQKQVLGQNIKTMYLEGQISTLEILASSKDLSDFVNKEQYRNAVANSIKTTLDKITQLKLLLQQQKNELEALIKEMQAQQTQLNATRSQQAELLAYTQGQKVAYDQQIKSNKAKIAELRRLQIIENLRFIEGSGAACGGGYPGHANGPWGPWGCNYPLDHNIDNWGMYNRQCVSYTAFKVAESGRHMPYWGGKGNANRWDDNARAEGIPVDGNPRVGDVAISNGGYYGHAMYVEHVYEDGRILVSQYNAGWDGRYSEKIITPGSLVFIHFP